MMSVEQTSGFDAVDAMLNKFIANAQRDEIVGSVVEEQVLGPVEDVKEGLTTKAATNFTNLLNSLPARQESEDAQRYSQKITSFLEEVFAEIDLTNTSLSSDELVKKIAVWWSKDTSKGNRDTNLTLANISLEIKGVGLETAKKIAAAFKDITTTYQEVAPELIVKHDVSEPEPEPEIVIEPVVEEVVVAEEPLNDPVETESESNTTFISWLKNVSYDDLKGVLFELQVDNESGEPFDIEAVANTIIENRDKFTDLQSLTDLDTGIDSNYLTVLEENLKLLISNSSLKNQEWDADSIEGVAEVVSQPEENLSPKPTSKQIYLKSVGSFFRRHLAWVNEGADKKQAENKFLKSLIKVGKLTKSEGLKKVGGLLKKSAIEKIVPVSIDAGLTLSSSDDLQNELAGLSKESQEELKQELEYIQKSLKDVPWQTMILIPGSKRLAKLGGAAVLGALGVASVYAAPVIAAAIATLDDLRKIRSGVKNEDKNISGRGNLYDSAASKYSIKMPGKKDENASVKEQEKNKVWKGRYLKGGSSVPMALLQRFGKIAGYLRSTSVQLSMRITRDRSIVSQTLDEIVPTLHNGELPDDLNAKVTAWIQNNDWKDIKKVGLALTRLRAFGNYGAGDVYGVKGSRVHKVNAEHDAEVFERIHNILDEVVTSSDNGGLSAKDVNDWKDWYDEKSNKGKGNWRVFSSVVGSAIGTFATLGLVQLGQNLFSGESAENIEELEERMIQQVELEAAEVAAVGSVLTVFENGDIPNEDMINSLPEGVMTIVENEDGGVDRIFNLDIGSELSGDGTSVSYKVDADGVLYVNEDGSWFGAAAEEIEDAPTVAATAGATATATTVIPTQTPPFVPLAAATDVGEAPTAVPTPTVTSEPPATAIPIESSTATATVTPTSTIEPTSTLVPPTDVATVTPLSSTPESESTVAPTPITESTVTPIPTPDLSEVHTLSDAEINTIYEDLEKGVLPDSEILNEFSSDSTPATSTSYDFDGDGNFDLRKMSDNEYSFKGRDNQTYILLVSNTDVPIEPFLFSAGTIYNPDLYTTAVGSFNSNIDQIMTALENGEIPEQSIIDSVPDSNIIRNDYGQVFRDINGDGNFDLVEDHHGNFYVLDENSEWININDVEPVPAVTEADVSATGSTDSVDDMPTSEADLSTTISTDTPSSTTGSDTTSTDVGTTPYVDAGHTSISESETGVSSSPTEAIATTTEVLPLDQENELVSDAIFNAIRGEGLEHPNGSLNVITKLFNAVNPGRDAIHPDSGFAIPGNATDIVNGSLPTDAVAWLFSDDQMKSLAGNIDASMSLSSSELAEMWDVDIDEASKIQDMFEQLNGRNADLALESLRENDNLMGSILELSTE